MQYTDARDLATWMVRMLRSASSGTFNAVGPGRKFTLAEVLEVCRTAASEYARVAESARVTWVREE
jgi:2'-hydroxyisoflavone reductase